MKRWHEVDRIGFDAFVSPDGLAHERLELCLHGQGILAMAIAEAAQRPVMSASMDLMFD